MDYAIVTVRIEQLDWQIDMELSTKTALKELAGNIMETFKRYKEEDLENITSLRIFYQGRELNEEGNLAAYGIWDGSFIEMKIESLTRSR